MLCLRGRETAPSPEGRSHSAGKGPWCRHRSAPRPPWRPGGGPGVGAAPGHRDTPGTSRRAPSLPPAAGSPRPGAKARGPRPHLRERRAPSRPQQLPAPPAPPSGPAAPACPARAGPARSPPGKGEPSYKITESVWLEMN
ncbi:translation initiation factor IF-2-like [Pyrgilauda ruficollis]|uniref:translation initiation factor IF-2-like n=1 Tax=Pyrgilauda ruficollis TaxID=221976 RepID=UPI001B885864|nr:translation initiation factor IF-2-like [Pyrgilauda ruficollis]XP_041331850.1 translation initiation factor IF-2-like [Pyrgilauda ruficollis]